MDNSNFSVNEILTRTFFYSEGDINNKSYDDPPDKLLKLSGEYSWLEFLACCEHFPVITTRRGFGDLDYTPPWIDDELLNYSLYGIKYLKF